MDRRWQWHAGARRALPKPHRPHAQAFLLNAITTCLIDNSRTTSVEISTNTPTYVGILEAQVTPFSPSIFRAFPHNQCGVRAAISLISNVRNRESIGRPQTHDNSVQGNPSDDLATATEQSRAVPRVYRVLYLAILVVCGRPALSPRLLFTSDKDSAELCLYLAALLPARYLTLRHLCVPWRGWFGVSRDASVRLVNYVTG